MFALLAVTSYLLGAEALNADTQFHGDSCKLVAPIPTSMNWSNYAIPKSGIPWICSALWWTTNHSAVCIDKQLHLQWYFHIRIHIRRHSICNQITIGAVNVWLTNVNAISLGRDTVSLNRVLLSCVTWPRKEYCELYNSFTARCRQMASLIWINSKQIIQFRMRQI